MQKAVVTGATGFIGYHLIRELLGKDVEIWAVGRKGSKDLESMQVVKGIHTIACGLENILALPEICSKRNFDIFYHLAWSGASGILRSNYDVQMSNVGWTCDCVQVAKQMQCKKIIVTGTVCEKQCDAIEKQKIFLPSSYYLLAKKYAGAMAKCIAKRIGIPLVWCQFYHPVGIFNKKEQLIANTIQKLLWHEPLKFGRAQGLFDVVDVRDLAHAMYLMGENELLEDTYFVGSGNPLELMVYLEMAKSMIDQTAFMQYGELDTIELPMERAWLDSLPFQRETGFTPIFAFTDSVEAMRQWLENEEYYDSKKWLI